MPVTPEEAQPASKSLVALLPLPLPYFFSSTVGKKEHVGMLLVTCIFETSPGAKKKLCRAE